MMNPPISLPWYTIWLKALTRPSVHTFEEISTQPGDLSGRAYQWASGGGLAVYAFVLIYAALTGGFSSPVWVYYFRFGATSKLTEFDKGLAFGLILLGAVMVVVFSPFYLTIPGRVIHWLATRIGGQGSRSELMLCLAAIGIPFVLINLTLVTLIPSLTGIWNLVIDLYQMLLAVLAVKAIYNISTGKAIITVVAGFIFLRLASGYCNRLGWQLR